MLTELLDQLRDDDAALIVESATSGELAQCQKDLAEAEFPTMPDGFVDFLHLCNGFAWNGVEFFSTYEIEVEPDEDEADDDDDPYVLPDIVTANEDFVDDYDELPGKLLIGRSDEEFYLYDFESGLYQVLDRTGLDELESFETFEELFEDVVKARMDAVDALN